MLFCLFLLYVCHSWSLSLSWAGLWSAVKEVVLGVFFTQKRVDRRSCDLQSERALLDEHLGSMVPYLPGRAAAKLAIGLRPNHEGIVILSFLTYSAAGRKILDFFFGFPRGAARCISFCSIFFFDLWCKTRPAKNRPAKTTKHDWRQHVTLIT